MKIYHYTSVKTLSLILKTKKIRFNRLDRVDDLEESIHGSGKCQAKLGMYAFVSCWTKDSTENLSLWNMYTGYKGVRIGLDEDMFVTYKDKNGFKSFFPGVGDITKDYLVFSCMNSANLYDVIYVDDLEDKIRQLMVEDVSGKNTAYISRIGLYKRTEWAFQKESRFRIVLLPFNIDIAKYQDKFNDIELFIHNVVSSFNAMTNNYPLGIDYIDINLNESKLAAIEVMIGPQVTDEDKATIKNLLKDYSDAKIIKSDFYGKINGKKYEKD